MPSLDALRHAAQRALRDGAATLSLGSLAGTPFTRQGLMALAPDDAQVEAVLDGGLTAEVWRLNAGGRRWALKRCRAASRVRNADGELAFVNELLRRAELEPLRAADPGCWAGLCPTQWADLQAGLILSPWLEGSTPQEWNERQLAQLFALGTRLWLEGFFEWDYSPGNLLDDGRQLMLFDFGYCYRFDPLRQFNSAGDGRSAPQFHPVERFETRCYFAHLLELEHSQGLDAALQAFALEKCVARTAYERCATNWPSGRPMRRWANGSKPCCAAGAWTSRRRCRASTCRRPGARTRRTSTTTCAGVRARRPRCAVPTGCCSNWPWPRPQLRLLGALAADEAALDDAALLALYRQRRAEALRWQLQ
jgi:hypothetical protein